MESTTNPRNTTTLAYLIRLALARTNTALRIRIFLFLNYSHTLVLTFTFLSVSSIGVQALGIGAAGLPDVGEPKDAMDNAVEPDYDVRPSQRAPRVPRTAIRTVIALLLLVNLAMSLHQLPLNRVIERRLCSEHYAATDPSVIDPDGRVDERLCKIDVIQKSLGSIQGVMETTWIVGGRPLPRQFTHR